MGVGNCQARHLREKQLPSLSRGCDNHPLTQGLIAFRLSTRASTPRVRLSAQPESARA